MIRNGLYSISTKLLDGVRGGAAGISVLRDGTMRGGGSVLYHFGSYHCSDGKWKGEVTSQEHTPTINVRPFAGYIASMGFPGTSPRVGCAIFFQAFLKTFGQDAIELGAMLALFALFACRPTPFLERMKNTCVFFNRG